MCMFVRVYAWRIRYPLQFYGSFNSNDNEGVVRKPPSVVVASSVQIRKTPQNEILPLGAMPRVIDLSKAKIEMISCHSASKVQGMLSVCASLTVLNFNVCCLEVHHPEKTITRFQVCWVGIFTDLGLCVRV